MVGAGSGEGESEGDVDSGVEIQDFERNKPLVVIHRQHRIEPALCGLAENGIGYGGASEFSSFCGIQPLNGRSDDSGFLVTERAIFSGVGVEAGHSNSGMLDAAALEEIRHK